MSNLHTPRILIVDDQDSLRKVLVIYMLKEGLEKLSQMREQASNMRARDADEIRAAIEAQNILDLLKSGKYDPDYYEHKQDSA